VIGRARASVAVDVVPDWDGPPRYQRVGHSKKLPTVVVSVYPYGTLRISAARLIVQVEKQQLPGSCSGLASPSAAVPTRRAFSFGGTSW
jgi:hypothetical protein